jgi:hypothetical protein
MSQTQKSSLNTLDRQLGAAVCDFERKQSRLREQLTVSQSTVPPQLPHRPKTSFGGQWLPGPLSYPWFLVVASVLEEVTLHIV